MEAIIAKLINKRVKGGYNAEQSRVLLTELVTEHHTSSGLALALVYNGFATERTCDAPAIALYAAKEV